MDRDLLAFCKIIRLVEDAISADDNGLQVYVVVVGDRWCGLAVRNKETIW